MLGYITCVMLCYTTCYITSVMLCYTTYVNCYVIQHMLYDMLRYVI